MGETRHKKTSQKSLKVQRRALQPIQNVTVPGEAWKGSTELTRAPESLSPLGDNHTTSKSLSESSSLCIEPVKLLTSNRLDLVKVASAGNKGLGVFTTQRIPAGTLVMADEVSIRLTSNDELSEEQSEDALQQCFQSLSKTCQKEYLALHNTNKAGFSKIKSIYYSNCYNLKRYRCGGSCIAPLASRINHSCVPSVQFSFSETLPCDFRSNSVKPSAENASDLSEQFPSGRNNGYLLFYSIKDIPKGKEIFSNYESAYNIAAKRQMATKLYYGFDCLCQSCSQHDYWMNSDLRRREMIDCDRKIKQAETIWRRAMKEHHQQKCYHQETKQRIGTDIQDEEQDNHPALPFSSSPVNNDQILSNGTAKSEALFAIATLEKLAALLLKEGLSGIELCDVLRALAKWSLRANDKAAAGKWTEKERQACITCFGCWSVRVKEISTRSEDWWKV